MGLVMRTSGEPTETATERLISPPTSSAVGARPCCQRTFRAARTLRLPMPKESSPSIDRFKAVNDTHGHAVGDRVIQHVAAVLREGTRASDRVARLGGEEFCVLLRDADVASAERLAERLGAAIRERPVEVGGAAVRVTASFGVAGALAGESWDALFTRADRALYEAKTAGRDRARTG